MRYIPVGNGIQQSMAGHGGIRLMLCVYQYTVYGQHGGRAARQEESTVYQCNNGYTCVRYTIYKHSIQPPSLRNARMRVSRVRVCAILLYYYNIIILLYLYIPNIPSISSIPNIPNIPNISNITNNGNIAL